MVPFLCYRPACEGAGRRLSIGERHFWLAIVSDSLGRCLNAHDVDAMMQLDAGDCVHINAGGRLFVDKKATSQHIEELLKGEHKDSHFPPLRLLHQRTIAPGVIILQAAWQRPSLDLPPAPKMIDMIYTFTLKRSGSGWLAEQIDAHDVAHPPPTPGETVAVTPP